MGTGFGIYETLQQKLIDTLESTGTSMQTKEAEQVWFKKKNTMHMIGSGDDRSNGSYF